MTLAGRMDISQCQACQMEDGTEMQRLHHCQEWCRRSSSTLVGQMKVSTKACHKEEGTDKHRLHRCPVWNEVRHQIPDFLQKVGAKSENLEERVEVAEWLERLKKEDEKKKVEEMHQQKVEQMIKSAEGSAGLLHKITKPTPRRGGAQILEEKKRRGCEVVRPL